MYKIKTFVGTGFLLFLTFLFGIILSAPDTNAEESDTGLNLVVPTSCSLSIANNNLSQTFNPGQYKQIGTTNLKATCNDPSGLAIYAVGYTDDTYGKDVLATELTTAEHNYDIATSTSTEGDDSGWSMTVANSELQGNYTATIENGFNAPHIIPDDHMKIASRNAHTDTITGANLDISFNAYISTAQPASTYTGKVKFTLVHPNGLTPQASADAVTVIYDGDGLLFPNGQGTNTVQYAKVSQPGEIVYVGSLYQEVMTSNITTGGTQNGPYSNNENVVRTITIPGADKVKVVLRFGISDGDTAEFDVVNVEWDGDSDISDVYTWYDLWSQDSISGTETYLLEGDTVTIKMSSWGTPQSGSDYGFYAKVYPVYNEEVAGATAEELPSDDSSFVAINGDYLEPINWKNRWDWSVTHGEGKDAWIEYFQSEDEEIIKLYIADNYDQLKGTSFTVRAYSPYTIIYNGNSASVGTMTGFEHILENAYLLESELTLYAPNFYKTGYGFAGWSEDRQATVGGTSTIYGPSEIIVASSLDYDASHTAVLYAIWVPSSGNLQDWDGCSSMNIGDVIALSDVRDNNTYSIAKLADGKCWMTENLRLDSENSADSSKAQGYADNFVGLANSEDDNFNINSTAPNSLYNTSNIQGNNQAHRFPRYNNNDTKIGGTNSSGIALTPNPGDQYDLSGRPPIQWYGYGNYYTWAAAIADTADHSGDEIITSTSICPSGWHLPLPDESDGLAASFGLQTPGSNNRDILKEYVAYPNNFVFSGYYSDSYARQRERDLGVYWLAASSARNLSGAYRCTFDAGCGYQLYIQSSSFVNPNSFNEAKTRGNTVRCVADETSEPSNQTGNNTPTNNPSNAPVNNNTKSTPRFSTTSTNNTVDEKDDTKGTNAKSTNTDPLGVKNSREDNESIAVTSGNGAEIYGTIAIAGAAALGAAGLFFLAGKRKKDDEEEENN